MIARLSVVVTALLFRYAKGLDLSIGSSGGNATSPLLIGGLYEDIYHSGDGGLYGEMLRNRAFQGSSQNGQASYTRTTDYWHPVGNGVALSVGHNNPTLSSALTYDMEVSVPVGASGPVGFYNDGFWGFNVDPSKRYVPSLYMQGNYQGQVTAYFKSSSGAILSNSTMRVSQSDSDGWKSQQLPIFQPSSAAPDANSTFYFVFDGAQLAGKTLRVNLLSLFKQTYKNRVNGLREDLAQVVADLGMSYMRLPGGNNLEGLGSPDFWKWNETIGDLRSRPGRRGTWGDINTDGFGILEQLQWTLDMGLTPVLGLWAGFYLDGETVPQASLQPYVNHVMDELKFLLGDASTHFGALRASLGYPTPFNISYVEIGNEDYLNGGTNSYYQYRFNAYYNPIKAKYPNLHIISSIIPTPVQTTGNYIDIHIYESQDSFAAKFDTFDQTDRRFPVLVGEYAAIYSHSGGGSQIGDQTFGIACAEAIFLLGAERNSDVIKGTAYGAMIKSYTEAPDSVAVMKHTATQVLKSTSYYVQQLFAHNFGVATLPVMATNGRPGPVYWSATKLASGARTIKLVNYYNQGGFVNLKFENSQASRATVTTLTSRDCEGTNKLTQLGGETTSVSTTNLNGAGGTFNVAFTNACEMKVVTVGS